MTFFICETCGTQYAESIVPPVDCPVCQDERQYVGWNGQTWTTHEALSVKYTLRIEEDDGLLGISLPSDFAIPQRALFLPTDAGNCLRSRAPSPEGRREAEQPVLSFSFREKVARSAG
jgi:hypothetical protein